PVEGTGLGLATCHGIVTQARGAIRVRSQVGTGTTFAIYLPTTTRTPADRGSAHFRGAEGGTEWILLLEDEPTVRRLAKRILEDHGYKVVTASTLREARDLCLKQEFALLLSDIRLPDGNGPRLAEDLCRANAGLRVVFISGFADGEAMEILDRNRFPLLYKPFGSEALARVIRETLDTGAPLAGGCCAASEAPSRTDDES
ncbi:MAG TPA: response regulator, partial [Polyangiaceae bacterium]|nr:response regulator [Polyangiaceae bacterium]